MPLQTADFDGLLVVAVHHATAFAEDIYGADSRTAQAQDVGVEDGLGAAAQIAAGDLFDEARNVDVRGAGCRARGVETEEAAVGFGERGLVVEGWVEVGEALQVLGDHRALPA